MSAEYTQFDWARDRYDVARYEDEAERMFSRIDRRLDKNRMNKLNKKNHRNYA
jgi:hypothetical protein